MVDPLSYFSFQPVLHDWCNKGCGVCYPVCGMMQIKKTLLLIRKSSPGGGSRFPLFLSEWSFRLYHMCNAIFAYVLSESLNNRFPSYYQRCRMNPESGVHYMSAWQVGEAVDGLGGVGIVVRSHSARFQTGDFVTSTFLWPWMVYFTYPDSTLLKVLITHVFVCLLLFFTEKYI